MSNAEVRRVVVVTGASDGIGAAAARVLARRGDDVVVVGRSPGKTHAVAEEVGAEYHVADFAYLDQVRDLAAGLQARHPRIDVLINNAGLIAGARRTATADGHELTFQVNHLAPFLLTVLLEERLVAARGRVITTSSSASTARGAAVAVDDLDMTERYDGLRAYQASKLANVLFARELARRWGPLGVSAAAVHPGMVRSQWGRSGPVAVRLVMNSPLRLAMRSPERGADTLVWLSTSVPGQDWQSGGYFADRKPTVANRAADDRDLAAELWDRSALMCGLQPSAPACGLRLAGDACAGHLQDGVVADGGGLGTPFGDDDQAGFDELQAVEQTPYLVHGPELGPAQSYAHVLLQGGRGWVLGGEQVMNEDETAGRQRLAEGGQHAGRIFLVQDVVKDAAQQQADRLVPVEVLADVRVGQDAYRVAQVGVGDERGLFVGEQGPGVGQHDGIVVEVDHAGGRVDPLGDLVHVVGGGQPGADVEQLPDADLADQVADDPAEHVALSAHAQLDLRDRHEYPVTDRSVGGEVVLPAEQVVVQPRDVGPRRVHGHVGVSAIGH
jgi:NAD(P)-dependent dehydrogenase (short-subunit alcohol dehydrogenase family)